METFANHLEGLHFMNDIVLVIVLTLTAAMTFAAGLYIIRKSKALIAAQQEDTKDDNSL